MHNAISPLTWSLCPQRRLRTSRSICTCYIACYLTFYPKFGATAPRDQRNQLLFSHRCSFFLGGGGAYRENDFSRQSSSDPKCQEPLLFKHLATDMSSVFTVKVAVLKHARAWKRSRCRQALGAYLGMQWTCHTQPSTQHSWLVGNAPTAMYQIIKLCSEVPSVSGEHLTSSPTAPPLLVTHCVGFHCQQNHF